MCHVSEECSRVQYLSPAEEQCILWLVRAARVPVPQLLQGQDLLLEGVLEHEVHEGVGHLNTTTSINMKNRAVNKISHDFTIFRGHSL